MALMIDLAKDPCPDPRDYGLVDFYHNKEGQVDYAYFYNSQLDRSETNNEESQNIKPESREEQRYTDICSEQAWDNMSRERERHAAFCNGLNEYEAWLNDWN